MIFSINRDKTSYIVLYFSPNKDKMSSDKCPSYFNNTECANLREENHKWCLPCSLILVKKQSKYKSLERKYYSETFSIPEKKTTEELINIYNKLKQIIELRKFIHDNGFCPQMRDTNHRLRIDNVSEYKKIIKKEIEKSYSIQHDIIEYDSECDDSTSDFEHSETQDSIPISAVENAEKKEDPISEDLYINALTILNLTPRIYNNILSEIRKISETYIVPKLGKHFMTAFSLQYLIMYTFCKHEKSMKKIKTYNGVIDNGLNLKKAEIENFNPELEYIKKTETVVVTPNSQQYNLFLNQIHIPGSNTLNTNELDVFLALYRQIPNIPLPKTIKSVNFYPMQKDIDELIERYPTTYKNRKNRYDKFRFIKSKDSPEYKYNLQTCLRLCEIESDGELYCYLKRTESAEKYTLGYLFISKSGEKIIKETEIDVRDYSCVHVFTPLITLNRDAIGLPPGTLSSNEEESAMDRVVKDRLNYVMDAQCKYLFRFE